MALILKSTRTTRHKRTPRSNNVCSLRNLFIMTPVIMKLWSFHQVPWDWCLGAIFNPVAAWILEVKRGREVFPLKMLIYLLSQVNISRYMAYMYSYWSLLQLLLSRGSHSRRTPSSFSSLKAAHLTSRYLTFAQQFSSTFNARATKIVGEVHKGPWNECCQKSKKKENPTGRGDSPPSFFLLALQRGLSSNKIDEATSKHPLCI